MSYFTIILLRMKLGGGEYIKEKKTNPWFYRYGLVPQSVFYVAASKTDAASKTEAL